MSEIDIDALVSRAFARVNAKWFPVKRVNAQEDPPAKAASAASAHDRAAGNSIPTKEDGPRPAPRSAFWMLKAASVDPALCPSERPSRPRTPSGFLNSTKKGAHTAADQALIEEFLRTKGATKCPTRFAEASQAGQLPRGDR